MILTILKFLPFALFAIAILFGGQYFIYRSLINVFGITSSSLKIAVSAVFSVLTVGFFIASALSHANQSPINKYLYIITSTWLGVALNLLLASGALWVIFQLSGLIGINFSKPVLGGSVFFLAIIVSIYGIWNAFHPQIKNINLSIKNLPQEWRGKTIIQLSDVHLGHIHGASFMQDVVNKTNAQNPDLILITGDLFDGMDGDLSVFVKPLNELRAKQGVFFVTGNHETYLGINEALRILNQTHIKILNNEIVNLNGLQIIGLAYPGANDSGGVTGKLSNEAGLIASLPGFDKKRPGILMYHAPTNIDQAAAAGINLQLSGHAHKGQIWPMEFFTWLIYGRYDYGLHTLGDFSIYTTSGVGTWGPPMRTTGASEIPVFKLE